MSEQPIKILVVGGTGATGQHLVRQLLQGGYEVKVVVRNPEGLPEDVRTHNNITIITGTILEMSDSDIAKYVQDCDAIASCLGHTLSFKGIFGHPRKLVADSVCRLCQAVQAHNRTRPVKFVLMNSSGCRNLDLVEKVSFAQHCIIFLLRLLLPPHIDNEKAGNYLRTKIGQNHSNIEWVVVRPDGLVNHDEVSPYTGYASPTRSAIFNAGTTSRINVAHFIAQLITKPNLWSRWKGQMPVIYNDEGN